MPKVNPILEGVPRNLRRRALNQEALLRRSGQWGRWQLVPDAELQVLVDCYGKDGWPSLVSHAMRNAVFSVLVREDYSGVLHLAVASLSGVRPSWYEMQRIKSDIAGQDATAVEVYPPQSEVVDGADMFHIWVLPVGLPFGLHKMTTGGSDGRHTAPGNAGDTGRGPASGSPDGGVGAGDQGSGL